MKTRLYNFPMPYENHTLFHNADWIWSPYDISKEAINLSLSYATSGYFKCTSGCGEDSFEGKTNIQSQLNNASPSFQGHIIKPSPGTYNYKCLRNDNFSNRSQ